MAFAAIESARSPQTRCERRQRFAAWLFVGCGSLTRSLATSALLARYPGFFRELEHCEMGVVPYEGHQFRIAGYDSGPRFAAPCLGEHNHDVIVDLLGMSEDDFASALAAGAIA